MKTAAPRRRRKQGRQQQRRQKQLPLVDQGDFPWRETVHSEFSDFLSLARPPELRGIRKFAEQEIVIPEGKYQGQRFRCERQPFSALLLDEVDSGRWNRYIITGTVQSGKTLLCFDIPAAWVLFELKETFIAGAPTLDIARDKWETELKPVIQAAPRLRQYLPDKGRGSKGGFDLLTSFKNGVDLRWMSGHGSDATRSAFTARYAAVTEADRMDEAGEASRESAPIRQIENRLKSFGFDSQFWGECTATIEEGFVWQEIKASTDSRIVCPCPHCGVWVCPEREHLVGWDTAEEEREAEDTATFICPACASVISEAERHTMNADAKLIHKGQAIDEKGDIHGEPPGTRTLGFRWNAFNNLFWSTAFVGWCEWKAQQAEDEIAADKELRQFTWAMPALPENEAQIPLKAEEILERTQPLPRRRLPKGTKYVAGGVDLRTRELHYVLTSWTDDIVGRTFDCGVIEVPTDKYELSEALIYALREFREYVQQGFAVEGEPKPMMPSHVVIDAGWEPIAVHRFVKETRSLGLKGWFAAIGRGQSVPHGRGGYTHPRTITKNNIIFAGDEYHIKNYASYRQPGIVFNSDRWKTNVHKALAAPPGSRGSLSLFHATTKDEKKLLRQYSKQIVAEKAVLQSVPGRGLVIVFDNPLGRAAHFLDAQAMALVASHKAGAIIIEMTKPIMVKHGIQPPSLTVGA